MYVNQKDLENELYILTSIQDLVPMLRPYQWQQSQKKTAIFDFRGYYNGQIGAGLDVNVRDIGANAYPNYFISADKVAVVRNYPQFDYFVVYYFETAKIARVYHLNNLELPEHTLHFRHKRADQQMTKPVHLVPANSHCGEVYMF
jgi:hypothetical protein